MDKVELRSCLKIHRAEQPPGIFRRLLRNFLDLRQRQAQKIRPLSYPREGPDFLYSGKALDGRPREVPTLQQAAIVGEVSPYAATQPMSQIIDHRRREQAATFHRKSAKRAYILHRANPTDATFRALLRALRFDYDIREGLDTEAPTISAGHAPRSRRRAHRTQMRRGTIPITEMEDLQHGYSLLGAALQP